MTANAKVLGARQEAVVVAALSRPNCSALVNQRKRIFAVRARSVWISFALFFALMVPGVSPASAQTTQTPQAVVMLTCGIQTTGAWEPGCDTSGTTFWNVGRYITTPFAATSGPGDSDPTWSADGTRIAFVRGNDIFVMSATGGTPVNITNNTANDWSPAWSPDGARIAFASTRDGQAELYLMNPDGSGVVRITNNVGFLVGPAWSPDGARIAFDCEVESGNRDICAINSDGTGFVRLTSDPAVDSGATWSPDGASIAFATTRYGADFEIAVMNADGSGVSQVGAGIVGSDPAWSPDGAQIAFDRTGGNCFNACIYTMKADGTDVTMLVDGAVEPAWMPARVPVATFKFACNGSTCNFDASGSKDLYGTITSYSWNFGDGVTGTGGTVSHTYAAGATYIVTLTVTDNNGATGTKIQTVTISPVASFTFACNGLACSFDGSGSKDLNGTITSYAWSFGEGTTGTGATVSHTYAAAGTYTVTLTVADNSGVTGTQSKAINVNDPPVASFTFTCNGLTCSFDGLVSRDSDGTITSYAWNFGDGTTGAGATVSHTYAAGGTCNVTLTVIDNGGATGTQSQDVTADASMHVGNLDRASTTQANTWSAFVMITVHNSSHGLVPNATVSGSWSNGGTAFCTTNSNGQCTVLQSLFRKTASVTFTVVNVTDPLLIYKPPDNHDPDGDSNGTSITVARP